MNNCLRVLMTLCLMFLFLSVNAADWKIKRGLNMSHWLSQNYSEFTGNERYNNIKEEDFRTIAHAGFDHIRLPIDEKELWTENGEKIPYTFNLIHQAIGWCKKYKLRVVLDLHNIRSHNFNSEAENTLFRSEDSQQRFLQMWKDLSEELIQYPNDLLAYELMNEPVAPEHDMWNKLVARTIAQIRQSEPERKIFVGSNRWQGVDFLKFLNLPENDKNLVISFHFYEPFLLTHYQASWIPEMQVPVSIHYPGQIISQADMDKLTEKQKEGIAWRNGTYDKAFLDQQISIAVRRAKELGLPLHCGEFGCIYQNVPTELRENWYRDMVSVLKKYDIPYTVWDYKGSFKIFNADYTPANTTILKALQK